METTKGFEMRLETKTGALVMVDTEHDEVQLWVRFRGAEYARPIALYADEVRKICDALTTAGAEIGAYDPDNEATTSLNSPEGRWRLRQEQRRNDDLVANQAARDVLFRKEAQRKQFWDNNVDEPDVDEPDVDEPDVDEEES